MEEYNIYCDESCHLEYDKSKIMVLGAIWVKKSEIPKITARIRDIKNKYGFTNKRELKWTKISNSAYHCYEDLINYFFDSSSLFFRVLIVDNKDKFIKKKKNDFDDFYYKMYFTTLNNIIAPNSSYHIYLDVKDTRQKLRVRKLKEVLSNSNYDFSHTIIKKVQTVMSHEIELMQILDILIGACSYYLRGYNHSLSKNRIISLIKKRSGYDLQKSTSINEKKFNIFHCKLRESYDL